MNCVALLGAILVLLGLPVTGYAQQEMRFPAEQFGEANLTLPESLQSLESLIHRERDNFERVSDFRTDSRYRRLSRAVGRLDLQVEDLAGERFMSTCTASLVAEDTLITNFHCIPGTQTGRRVPRAFLRLGYLSQDRSRGERYPVVLPPIEMNRQLDYSIVKVKGKPGLKYGTVKLNLRDARASEALLIIHHPAGLPKRLTRRNCLAGRYKPLGEQTLSHRCDTLPGSSGSLIFADDDLALVGLHYAGFKGIPSAERHNSAKRMTTILEASPVLQSLAKLAPGNRSLPPASPPHATAAVVDQALVGTWEIWVPNTQGTAQWIIDIESDGMYRFRSSGPGALPPHVGRFRTPAKGHWSLKVPTPRWEDGGTYQVLAPDVFILTGKLGAGRWTRYRGGDIR